MPTEPRQITGDDIILELLRNCDAGQFKIRYTTILPSVYRIYLHPTDFDLTRPVHGALKTEARRALIDRIGYLAEAGRPSSLARHLGIGSGQAMEYKILDPDWTIEFHADSEEKLQPGEIEIYSELASAPTPEFDGALTQHVTKRRIHPPPSKDARDATPDVDSSSTTATAPATRPITHYAHLRFQTPAGPESYSVTKDVVVIGRGGKSFWVDLKLEAPPDVSREHCRIRRDPATGRFFIQDVSQYGTSIDGKAIPVKNSEMPLPSRCKLTLADVFELEFEAA